MKVSKQNNVEWHVTVDGKSVAWIRKLKLGYEVEIKMVTGTRVTYFEPSFKEAKKCVRDLIL